MAEPVPADRHHLLRGREVLSIARLGPLVLAGQPVNDGGYEHRMPESGDSGEPSDTTRHLAHRIGT